MGVAAILAAIFQMASKSRINEGDGMWHGLNFNLAVYVGSLCAAFLIYMIFAAAADLIRRKRAASGYSPVTSNLRRRILYVIYTAFAAASFVLIYEIYAKECDGFAGEGAATYLRQQVPHGLYFGFIVFIVAATLFSFAGKEKTAGRNIRFRIALALIFAVINAIALYCPNIFVDRASGVAHVHAVTNSIVHVAHFKPYDAHNISIYGHYGLICLPFVKLLGDDLFAVMQTIVVMGFVTFAAAFYTVNKVVRRDSAYFMALLSITGTTTLLNRRGHYFQTNPIRLLFPMLTLALIAYDTYRKDREKKKLVILLELAVGCGAVIWNNETGLFCVCVMMCVIVFRSLYEHPLWSRYTLSAVGRAILYGLICAAGAYGIVNLYNIVCGGTVISPRLFIYPIHSGNYDYNHLRAPLSSVASLYFAQILLFFLTALITLRRHYLKISTSEKPDTLYFALALSGLSSLIYFMNRTAYGNIAISYIQMCILLASYGEDALGFSKAAFRERLKSPFTYFKTLMTVLVFGCSMWLAIESVLYINACLDVRANNTWKTESMIAGIEEIRAKVPENTFGIGFCVPELYYQLGWDSALPMIDWSDMNELNREYAIEEALKHEYVLVGGFRFHQEELYDKIDTINIWPYDYKLFRRKEKIEP